MPQHGQPFTTHLEKTTGQFMSLVGGSEQQHFFHSI